MAGHRMFLTFTTSANFLCRRNCLVNSNQNITSKILRKLTKDILPPAPKKPTTAFFEFLQSVRTRIRAENAEAKATDIARLASVEWSKLDPDTKQKYQKVYEEKYKNYCTEFENYKANITPEQMELLKQKENEYSLNKQKLELKQRAKALGKPTRPINAFLIFVAEKKSKLAGGRLMELVESCKKEWFEMADEEKQKYKEKAKMLMENYNAETKKWKEKMMELGHVDVISRASLNKHTRNLKVKEK